MSDVQICSHCQDLRKNHFENEFHHFHHTYRTDMNKYKYGTEGNYSCSSPVTRGDQLHLQLRDFIAGAPTTNHSRI